MGQEGPKWVDYSERLPCEVASQVGNQQVVDPPVVPDALSAAD